ncbi:Peptidase M48, Ste24p precursor [Gulosibacter sp. 10]|nr:Peptidase M48, Ste24p precursor [Gulosibacter sp. 10]
MLAAVAFALAWPVPILLDRRRWTFRSPEIALVLWQAIALSGGVAMIASLALFGLAPFGGGAFGALGRFIAAIPGNDWPDGFTALHAFSLISAALLFTHLLLNLIVTTVKTARTRRRHREMLTLLSSPVPGRPRTRIITEDVPLAYCIPDALHGTTVVSEGLVRRLDPAQLEAVIEHERAHLSQRHTVVLTLFASWASALPWFPIANRALLSVELLIEALADDTAGRRVPRRVVGEAIQAVSLHDGVRGGAEAQPAGSEGRTKIASYEAALAIRVSRLGVPPAPLHPLSRVCVIGVSGLLFLGTIALALWPM